MADFLDSLDAEQFQRLKRRSGSESGISDDSIAGEETGGTQSNVQETEATAAAVAIQRSFRGHRARKFAAKLWLDSERCRRKAKQSFVKSVAETPEAASLEDSLELGDSLDAAAPALQRSGRVDLRPKNKREISEHHTTKLRIQHVLQEAGPPAPRTSRIPRLSRFRTPEPARKPAVVEEEPTIQQLRPQPPKPARRKSQPPNVSSRPTWQTRSNNQRSEQPPPAPPPPHVQQQLQQPEPDQEQARVHQAVKPLQPTVREAPVEDGYLAMFEKRLAMLRAASNNNNNNNNNMDGRTPADAVSLPAISSSVSRPHRIRSATPRRRPMANPVPPMSAPSGVRRVHDTVPLPPLR